MANWLLIKWVKSYTTERKGTNTDTSRGFNSLWLKVENPIAVLWIVKMGIVAPLVEVL